jgi:hypothetical protein
VNLDEKTFEINPGKPSAQLSLVTDGAQAAYASHIMDKGGLFLANSQPVTRRMQNLHFPRFVETPEPARGFHSALFSPLAYGNDCGKLNEAELFQFLRDRVNCCCVTHLGGFPVLTRPCATAEMFPFTPLDIRPGVLTGVERIITARSGQYGWKPPFKARLFVYDKAGVLSEANPPVRSYMSKVRVKMPELGMAIIERADHDYGDWRRD